MKIWFDTEFIEDGKTIEPLSIGLVSENGRTYYAEFVETDRTLASQWIMKNVIPKLKGPMKTKKLVASEIIQFVGENPEFWAYYADYDWVVLCQLYGTMMSLPKGWPKFCLDLKQFAYHLSIPIYRFGEDKHNALSDAMWARDEYLSIMNRKIAA